MALLLHQAMPKNATPRLQFTLPETNLSLDIEGEVAWADQKGRVGLRFRNLAPGSQQLLEKWLNEKMPKQTSGSTEQTGQGSEAIQ
jgi:hypothetical protein